MLDGRIRKVVLVSIVVLATITIGSLVTAQSSSQCVAGGAVAPGNEALANDCDTLLGMKAALRGTGGLNWWTGRSLQDWDGVRVQNGRVTEVSLSNRSLNGIFPAGFGSLSALITLDLGSNSLTGTIPSEIGNLSNLQSLLLNSNSLTGQLPTELNNLTSLTQWRLSGNSFTGCVPRRFSMVADNDIDAFGLAVCGGTTPPPPPPPPPPPMPGSAEYVDNCQLADIEAVYGDTYSLDREGGPIVWEHNGRSLHGTYWTRWRSEEYANLVICKTLAYDNLSSAVAEFKYDLALREVTTSSLDILDYWRIRDFEQDDHDHIPMIGDDSMGLKVETGRKRSSTDDSGVWQEQRLRVGTMVMFRRDDEAIWVMELIYLNGIDPSEADSTEPPPAERVVDIAELIDARIEATPSDAQRSISSGLEHSHGDGNAYSLEQAFTEPQASDGIRAVLGDR